jgi:hypothetical protein
MVEVTINRVVLNDIFSLKIPNILPSKPGGHHQEATWHRLLLPGLRVS